MKTEIQAHLNDPKILETLYRSDRTAFKQSFNTLYPTLSGNVLADYWYERLNYEPESKHRGTQGELPLVILVATLAAFVAQFPSLFAIDGEFFYSRNIGFIVFPFFARWLRKSAIPIRASLP